MSGCGAHYQLSTRPIFGIQAKKGKRLLGVHFNYVLDPCL
jgi:hypothetical protein